MKRISYFFFLSFTSLAAIAFIYWAIGWLLLYKTGNLKEARMLANDSSSSLEDNLVDKCQDIGLEDNQKRHCSFETEKSIRGESLKVKSTIQLEEGDSNQVNIKIKHEIKDSPDYMTEAGFCGADQCAKSQTTDADDLANTLWEMLNEADSQIDKAARDQHDTVEQQKELEERIANCEISEESTLDKIVKITTKEKQECQLLNLTDQLAQTNAIKRTQAFHYDVKEMLWNIVSQNRPNQELFLEEYMKKLQAPSFFDHQQFSVQSSFSLMEKYHEFRLFMDHLDRQKRHVSDELIQQLPDYLSTDIRNPYAESDERFLKRAWRRNFQQYDLLNYEQIFNKRQRERQERNIEDFRLMLRRLYGDYTLI